LQWERFFSFVLIFVRDGSVAGLLRSNPESRRRRAAEEPGCILLEDSRSGAGRGLSYFFRRPVDVLHARTLDELPGLFARIEQGRAAGLWAAGYVGYECGYHWEPTAAPEFAATAGDMPLASFGLYRAPEIFMAVPEPFAAERFGSLPEWRFGIGEATFTRKVEAIRAWIEAGDTYQVNLTDRFTAESAPGPEVLFAQMMQAQPVAYGALLHLGEAHILSASPELFFRQDDLRITVRPMKGTARRGRDSAEDAEGMAALAQDEKNRAENLMIVDLLRSDLGRIAEMGSVRVEKLFAVERLPTLLQMSSEITATLRADVNAYAVFAALFPSGSIVGAPKVRTMQVLRQLEDGARGVYTGAIGYFAPGRQGARRAVFSVAIRTAVVRGSTAEMGAGAGITYSSEPAAEYAECLLKADFLREEPFELIETMRVEDGRCALLERHLGRLAASAAYFDFACQLESVRAVVDVACARASQAGPHPWRLRLTLDPDGCVRFSAAEGIEPDAQQLDAMLWPEPVCSRDRFLRHKTTRRALYDQAMAQARAEGCVDAIFLNERGQVTEGAIHSVMVRHGRRWRTPTLDAGVLPGVFRAHLLATMPELEEADFYLDDLLAADEIWLTNAVRGVRPVRLVGRRPARPALRPAAAAPHAIVRN
jgi:para-aminobenzoate synthetase/4-amino-4-deoxychorismate lyase